MRPSVYPIIMPVPDLSSGLYRIYSPADNTTIPGGSAVFSWTAGEEIVTDWWLYVGSTPGGGQYHSSGSLAGSVTSSSVTGLPTSGVIYARLWARISGTWVSKDYTYTGAA
jgi:hypothetical protein